MRRAVGLRDLREQFGAAKATKKKADIPEFKQYRERDGTFRFKLFDNDNDGPGYEVFESVPYQSPKVAGQVIARIMTADRKSITTDDNNAIYLDGELVAHFTWGANIAVLEQALRLLTEANE